jgi:hypothetical protein
MWETHSRPALGDRPQAILNKQIGSDCDFVVGAFWTRLGTPTGDAESGTAEEIENMRASGKEVLLYFSSAPAVPESIEPAQYEALTQYRKSLEDKGLYFKYESLSDLRDQFQRHLAKLMIELVGRHGVPGQDPGAPPSEEAVSARQRAVLVAELGALLRRLVTDWESERDSNPYSTDEAKQILTRHAVDLATLGSMEIADTVGIGNVIREALKQIRTLQRHQTYLDGGKSLREFWTQGDEVIESLRRALVSLS